MALLQKCSGMLPVGHSEQSNGGHDVVSPLNSRETELLRADQNG
jgi:hypothetical protein